MKSEANRRKLGNPRGRRLVTLATSVLALALLVALATSFMICMPGRSYSGELPPLTNDERLIADRLEAHVTKLAGDIGERNIKLPAELEASARYIEDALSRSGTSTSRQAYQSRSVTVHNIVGERPGSRRASEIVVVGAHYDSVFGCPGANDNGTGVAALLELATLLSKTQPDRTLRFVAFANEEPPFFRTWEMGSRQYAQKCRQENDTVVAMLSLETVGFFSDEEGTQHYPFPFSLFYPSKGNFIGFVGNIGSRRLVRQVVGSFRGHARFPAEGVAAPGWITGIDWSDHWSFWEEGYPGLMITDTAPFRYEHYHEATDTPDKVDYGRLARVVAGLANVVEELCRDGEHR